MHKTFNPIMQISHPDSNNNLSGRAKAINLPATFFLNISLSRKGQKTVTSTLHHGWRIKLRFRERAFHSFDYFKSLSHCKPSNSIHI